MYLFQNSRNGTLDYWFLRSGLYHTIGDFAFSFFCRWGMREPRATKPPRWNYSLPTQLTPHFTTIPSVDNAITTNRPLPPSFLQPNLSILLVPSRPTSGNVRWLLMFCATLIMEKSVSQEEMCEVYTDGFNSTSATSTPATIGIIGCIRFQEDQK